MQMREDKYNVAFSKTAYVSGKNSDVRLDMQLDFNTNQVNIGSTITGKVIDSNNNSIEGAIVKLMDSNLNPLTNATTDSNGNYSINSMPYSNLYNMVATSLGKLLSKPVQFTLTSGQSTTVNFILETDPIATLGAISGNITDINLKPIIGAIVSVYMVINGINTLIAVSYTDMSGIFSFNELNPGNYIIMINALGYLQGQTTINVQSGIITTLSEILNVNPQAANGIVSGIITDSSGSMASGADVILYSINTNNSLTPVAFTETNTKGMYTFINVPSGNYLVKSNQIQLVTTVTLSTITPFFKEVNVFSTAQDSYAFTRIPGIITTSNGTLIAYCEGRSSSADNSTKDLIMKRSTDGGVTWSNLIVLCSGIKNGITYSGPVMIPDKNSGLVHFLYCVGDNTAYYAKSLDYGVTWSSSVNITSTFNTFKPEYNWAMFAIGPGNGIQLKNGRLLIPVWMSTSTAQSPSLTSTIYSDDNGVTWKRGQIIQPPSNIPNPNETTAVELIDGSVLLNMRNTSSYKKRALTVSKDGVSNWSTPQLNGDLDDEVCFGSVLRFTRSDEYGNNRILFSNVNNTYTRSNLTIKISMDEGVTWPIVRDIYTGGAAYSDLTISLDKKSIYCLYEKDGYNKVALATFNLEWITMGAQSLNPLTVPNEVIYPIINNIVFQENWNSLANWNVAGTGQVAINTSGNLNMSSNDNSNTSIINNNINIRQKYTIEFKAKLINFVTGTLGTNVTLGTMVCDGQYRLMLDFKADGVYAITGTGSWGKIANVTINNDWNIWRVNVDTGKATLYMNNQLLTTFTLALVLSNDFVEHWINGLSNSPAQIEEEYFSLMC